DDAVHEHIGAFFNSSARGLQFGRVNCDAQFARVTFFDRCADDRPETVERMIFIDDVPNLHEIGILRGEFAHEVARLIGRIDFYDRRIAKIELWSRDAGDERTGDSDARRFCGGVRDLAHFEVPKRTAHIDDRGNSAAQITCEGVVEVRLDPSDLLLVWPDAVQIDNVGPRERIAGLEEMHVRIDVTGQDEFAFATDPLRASRNPYFFAAANRENVIALDDDDGVVENLRSSGIDERSADKRDFLFGCVSRSE